MHVPCSVGPRTLSWLSVTGPLDSFFNLLLGIGSLLTYSGDQFLLRRLGGDRSSCQNLAFHHFICRVYKFLGCLHVASLKRFHWRLISSGGGATTRAALARALLLRARFNITQILQILQCLRRQSLWQNIRVLESSAGSGGRSPLGIGLRFLRILH